MELHSLVFWAKTSPEGQPGISVRGHTVIVGCVAATILARLPLVLAERALVVWLAACHDLGKISPGFLRKCEAWLVKNGLCRELSFRPQDKPEPDHSKVSQFTIQHILHDDLGMRKEDAALWAAVAGMHHGTPHWRGEWKPAENSRIPHDDPWEQERRKLAVEVSRLFGKPALPPQVDLDDFSSLWWAAGLVTVADWIGSDEEFFDPAPAHEPSSLAPVQAAANKALDSIGFGEARLDQGRPFADLFSFLPRPLQSAALETIQGPGLYIIEAPMGLGKTEAALGVAYELISRGLATGLYFALPTQATSNRIHERVSQFLLRAGSAAPRLIHGGSWLVDENLRFPAIAANQPGDSHKTARDWFASGKRALLAPFGVGTIDQLLLGVIAVKHFFVRHFALAGKVVVLDEVHSYDVYTGTLVQALIKALVKLRCTVIVLSATLTRERRECLLTSAEPCLPQTLSFPAAPMADPFPLITGVLGGSRITPRPVEGPPPKPEVALRFGADDLLLNDAFEATRRGACVLWICNTVEKALETYNRLPSIRREGDPEAGLLHARFPFFRRQELEEHWMRKLGKERRFRPRGCFLISTQIVEQSVDLDADLIVTELAPTDMLFQRLGRLWRHHPSPDLPRPLARPEFWILNEQRPFQDLSQEPNPKALCEALGRKAKVYSPYLLLRTLEQWQAQAHVNLPADIRPWLEATYHSRIETRPGWQTLLCELQARVKKHAGRAEAIQNVWNLPDLTDEEGVATRLNQCPTLPLVLLKEAHAALLIPFHGDPIPVQSLRFSYATARALHQNLVKAPAWWFAHRERLLKSVPSAVAEMVSLHTRGDVDVGVVRGNTIALESLEEGCELDFDLSRGLSRKTTAATATRPAHCDDDSED